MRLHKETGTAVKGNHITLLKYCRELDHTLRKRGYSIVHGRALQKALDGISGRTVPAQVYEYVRRNNKIVDERDIIAGHNAIADKNYKLILLPECKNLVEAMANKNGLNARRLRKQGLNDTHIYIDFFIHEASHVLGLNGHCWSDSDTFRFNEFDTYLHEFTRLMRVTGFGTQDRIPNLLANRKAMNSIIGCFKAIDGESKRYPALRYQFTHSAAEWAITRANKAHIMKTAWNGDKDRFNLDVLRRHLPEYCATRQNGAPHRERAYILAAQLLKVTAGHNVDEQFTKAFPDNYVVRDNALQAARHCLRYSRAKRAFQAANGQMIAAKGDMLSEQAALILRQLARSIDHVKHYADDYRPPANGMRITHRCPVPPRTPG